MKLELKNITHRLGLNSFSYNTTITNDITGIYGPSGAGKTTLLNCIAGIEKPLSGSIVFNDKTLFHHDEGINTPVNKRNLGVVFQDNYLFPHLTILQNLNYSKPYIKNRTRYIDFDKVVSLLGIEDLLTKKPNQLSGGEKQRVAIGRTLLSQPELLLFDEPFSNLDRRKRKQIISYLLKINHQFKIPLLIISHDLEDILKLTNHLLIINNGCIEAAGDYLNISEEGHVPDIICHKRYINIFEAYCSGFDVHEKQVSFSASPSSHNKLHLSQSTSMLQNNMQLGQRIRLCLHPDDIALANNRVEGVSIQNQLKGRITQIISSRGSHYVTVDCGFVLVAEVTQAAVKTLQLELGQTVYCLIKAKAIEVVHSYIS